jgi:hypothetical protein
LRQYFYQVPLSTIQAQASQTTIKWSTKLNG